MGLAYFFMLIRDFNQESYIKEGNLRWCWLIPRHSLYDCFYYILIYRYFWTSSNKLNVSRYNKGRKMTLSFRHTFAKLISKHTQAGTWSTSFSLAGELVRDKNSQDFFPRWLILKLSQWEESTLYIKNSSRCFWFTLNF